MPEIWAEMLSDWFDLFMFKIESVWSYLKDLWEYSPDDLDACCRR